MTQKPGIFPTFFVSGFECSTFDWKDKGRRNLIRETQHDTHIDEDYRRLRELGIGVAREGIPWPLVDKNGSYDFSSVDPYIEAFKREKILPIWDLCHYGYPDGLDPFADDFADHFARYCRAVAEYVVPRLPGPHFFTPINEITFFGFIGGQFGWVAPFKNTRDDGFAFRKALCRADIAGVKAIREVDPEARMVHIDPVVHIVAPLDEPDKCGPAFYETYEDTFLCWDILYGRAFPEYGGSPEILDIVGANNYSFGQMEYRANGQHEAIDPGDPRIKPLCDLLELVWDRYHRPILISETSGLEEGRDEWMRDVVNEALAAVNRGIDMHGICVFPAVDMPDWHTGEWLHNGICDLVPEGDDLKRVPYEPYIQEIRRWQREFKRVTELDEDPLSDPVELQDIIDAAHRLQPEADANWH
jgi:beta-glucosidase/6-phospho-beta-glucosidase/beta-galactosidase